MKLFWKLFLGMVGTVIITFTVFGFWLLNSAFQTELNREKERSIDENQMYQYAFLTSIKALPEKYILRDKVVAEIAGAMKENMKSKNSIIRIYDKDKNAIYQEDENISLFIKTDMKNKNGVYQITKRGGNYYLETLFRMDNNDYFYYLEITREINYIYEDREHLYDQYKIVLIVTCMTAGILSFIISVKLTKPIYALSKVTKKFAEGDYGIRAARISDDEVGRLIENFNKMADQLESNMKELKDSARKQEDFTAAFAHELKTPLTSIIGYSEMLRSMELPDEERREAANYIYTQGKRMERLTYKMLDLIITEKQSYDFTNVNILEIEDIIKKIIHFLPGKKNIEFIMQLEAGNLYGDRDLLLSLIVNLLDNAVKASGNNGKIWITGKILPEGYEIIIEDNGRGIPQKDIQRVTEPFYMIDKSRSRKKGGAGLGMALCKKIVEIHQADWVIESEEDKGTSIKIVFKGRGQKS